MQKLTLTVLSFILVTISFAQTAEELNQKSKNLLGIGDLKNAVPLIKQAAEMGNPEAEYNFGICYQQGIEVAMSDSIANLWFLKAAMHGSKNGQFKVAYSYALGRGLPKNDKQALYWSLKCAEQNDPECMFNVISCYLNGKGTHQSVDSMMFWAARLALLDIAEDLQSSGKVTSTRVNLAGIYEEGKLVPKDLTKSYMWFLIYNESKADFSVSVQQQNIEKLQIVERSLSTKEKEAAMADAEKILHRRLTNLGNLHKQQF
jgi:TPR repeat protein